MGLRESFDEMDTGVKVLLVIVLVPAVLVVGIAVLTILAAFLGAFVLGLGGEVDTAAPTASFSFQMNGAEVEIVHTGGDAVAADRLLVAVNDDSQTWAAVDPDLSGSDSVRAGDSVTVSGVASGDRIEVRWRPPDGETSVILGRYDVA